jgi:hypothetical protein
VAPDAVAQLDVVAQEIAARTDRDHGGGRAHVDDVATCADGDPETVADPR